MKMLWSLKESVRVEYEDKGSENKGIICVDIWQQIILRLGTIR